MKVRKSLKIGTVVALCVVFGIAWVSLRHHEIPQQQQAESILPVPVTQEEITASTSVVEKVEVPAESAPVAVEVADAPAPETEAALAQFGLSATSVIPMSVKAKVLHPIIIGRQEEAVNNQ